MFKTESTEFTKFNSLHVYFDLRSSSRTLPLNMVAGQTDLSSLSSGESERERERERERENIRYRTVALYKYSTCTVYIFIHKHYI